MDKHKVDKFVKGTTSKINNRISNVFFKYEYIKCNAYFPLARSELCISTTITTSSFLGLSLGIETNLIKAKQL